MEREVWHLDYIPNIQERITHYPPHIKREYDRMISGIEQLKQLIFHSDGC